MVCQNTQLPLFRSNLVVPPHPDALSPYPPVLPRCGHNVLQILNLTRHHDLLACSSRGGYDSHPMLPLPTCLSLNNKCEYFPSHFSNPLSLPIAPMSPNKRISRKGIVPVPTPRHTSPRHINPRDQPFMVQASRQNKTRNKSLNLNQIKGMTNTRAKPGHLLC